MITLRTWHWSRLLRAAIATAFLGQGFATGDTMAYVFGVILGVQAIFNMGCSLNSSCTAPVNKATEQETGITYQEIR